MRTRILIHVIVLVAIFGAAAAASASHGFSPDRRMGPLHPNQGGQAYYTLCSSDTAVRQNWAWGPVKWQTAMNGAMFFTNTPVDCTAYSNEIIQWQGFFVCAPADWACHFWSNMTSHGHNHLNQGMIVWDQGDYNANSGAQRRALSAHEMGHGVGLADHSEGSCQVNTIMARIDPVPCYEAPTLYDALNAGIEHGYW